MAVGAVTQIVSTILAPGVAGTLKQQEGKLSSNARVCALVQGFVQCLLSYMLNTPCAATTTFRWWQKPYFPILSIFQATVKKILNIFDENSTVNRANQNQVLRGYFHIIWTCQGIVLKSGVF